MCSTSEQVNYCVECPLGHKCELSPTELELQWCVWSRYGPQFYFCSRVVKMFHFVLWEVFLYVCVTLNLWP
jgi:hypothetical protein